MSKKGKGWVWGEGLCRTVDATWGRGPASWDPPQENPADTFLFCLPSPQGRVQPEDWPLALPVLPQPAEGTQAELVV